MNERSLNVLETLIGDKRRKANRRTELLREPEEEYTQDWYMCVPKCFNDALDIKKTTRIERVQGQKQEKLVWTQGTAFSFKVGDTMYDTPSAYSLPWSQALQKLRLAVQVKEVIDAMQSDKNVPGSSANVVVEIFVPNDTKTMLERTGEHTLPQDDFVRFLIIGPEGKLKNLMPNKKQYG
jgi:hypothetical protein